MRVLYFDLKGRVGHMAVPDPTVGDREIVVRTRISVISTGTELSGIRQNRQPLIVRALKEENLLSRIWGLYRSGLLLGAVRGESPTGAPFKDKLRKRWLLGYSSSGVVVSAGRLSGFVTGDRVACAGHAHADLMKIPASMAVRIPDSVDDEGAAFTAIGAVALNAVHRADAGFGDICVVIGLGLIGLLSVQILHAYGVKVIGVDPLPARRETAINLGALDAYAPGNQILTGYLNELSRGRGADSVLITAGSASSGPSELAGKLVAPYGRIVVVGGGGISFPRGDIYRKEADILIARSYGPGRYDPEVEEKSRPLPKESARWTAQRNFEEFLRLASEDLTNPSRLISRRTSFETPERAYDELISEGDEIIASVFSYEEPVPDIPLAPSILTKVSRIPVAVIGHGQFASNVRLPALAGSENYDLRWLIGRSTSRAKVAGEKFGFANTGNDVEAVLSDDDVEAVFVLTRHDSHAAVARRALQAGKAVFVEKPVALTLADAQSICELVDEKGLPFAVGFNRRHSALAARCRDYASDRKTPIQLLFRVESTYLPPEHWVYDEHVGGGRVVGEACHFIDFLRWILQTEVVDMTASGGTWTHPGMQIVDNFVATFTFACGSMGTLVYGDLGRVDSPKERFELYSGAIALALEDFATLHVSGDIDASVRFDRSEKGFARELDAFAEYLRSSEPGDLASARDGEAALRIGLEIQKKLLSRSIHE